MAKHWSQYFEMGHSSIEGNIAYWQDIAETREMLPTNVEIDPKKIVEQRKTTSPRVIEEHGSIKSNLRGAESIRASTGSLADVTNNTYQMSRPRAMSEHSLASSPQSNNISKSTVVTALYPYLSSGENQLSFYEGDKILLVGEKVQPRESYQGWQFGENLRTNVFGWFPVSYVQYESEG